MTPPMTALVAALGAATIVFLALWLAERVRRRLAATREESEWDRIDRELDLAEQDGRFRIAGELADVAVAAVSRLASQAEGLRYAAGSDPEATSLSAGALETAARDALADLRRLQDVVAEGRNAALPSPDLHSAGGLFRVLRDAGLAVGFTESGKPFELRPGAELAIFRILQTSLGNALKHGGPGTKATVSFAWTGDGLQVSVDDDGIRAAARRSGLDRDGVDRATAYTMEDDLHAITEPPEGAGLTELRERASLFGGVLTAKTVPGVGFSLCVVFPALRHHNGIHGVRLR
ncbi:two-component system sensor protein [Leifsonia xyli subsp. cynodontis DSM 46306]|uniref:histidine kinase n=1 Tax=Leifsonia xyli subsp. cynodontis DSM 46306 TaxID=1389489 RepID=U3P6N7_LEIXC|nr:ATP-binding protein [Leifsonia xyli]AGW41456.1 two-component system sensor protein [Leifsonia xyli subsp. cynodontis DSM 46306]